MSMTYISRFSDFVLCLEGYLVDEQSSFFVALSQCDTKFDPIINLGHSDLYFMVQCKVGKNTGFMSIAQPSRFYWEYPVLLG